MLVNTVILEGRLANAVKIKNINTGNGPVAKAMGSLVWSVKTSKGKDIVYPVPFEAWGGIATTLANYTTKGSLISLVGELTVDNYDGKYAVRVKATQLGLLETTATTNARRAAAGVPQGGNGYAQPQGYGQPQSGNGYHQQQGYNQPQAGYNQPAGNGYNQPAQGNGYRQPQAGYQAPAGNDCQAPVQGGNCYAADDDVPF